MFTPLDIERHCINMVRGSHHVGAYMPSQLGGNRPTPDLGRYGTPLKGLYLCGASSHTGGAVTGSPGYNAANVIAQRPRRAEMVAAGPEPVLAAYAGGDRRGVTGQPSATQRGVRARAARP